MSLFRRPTVHAWALYDFAATAFSMNMVSTYVSLWVVKDHGASDLTYGLAKSLSMVAVVLISPWLGAMSDRAGNRRPFMLATVALFVGCALAMGFVPDLYAGLALFALANVGLQLSTVFYNAMLPALAPAEAMGRLSGYGKMIGYVGSLVAVGLGLAFASGKLHLPAPLPSSGSQAVFVPTALLCLAAALPLCLMRGPVAPSNVAHRPSWRRLIAEMREPGALPGVGAFLLASLFFFDTINTIRDFMSIYLVRVVGFSEVGGSLQRFLAIVVVCSLFGALGWGFLVDRVGAKRALIGVLALLALGFFGLVVAPIPAFVQYAIGPLLGLAFGGVLVTTRPLLAALVPVARQGEFFGAFVVCNDCAAIVGPITWGLTVQALAAYGTFAYQAAVGVQLVFLLVGLALLARVPSPGASHGLADRAA